MMPLSFAVLLRPKVTRLDAQEVALRIKRKIGVANIEKVPIPRARPGEALMFSYEFISKRYDKAVLIRTEEEGALHLICCDVRVTF